MMNLLALHERQKAFLMVALLADRENARQYLPFLPPQEEKSLGEGLQFLESQPEKQQKKIIINELRSLRLVSHGSGLQEIHPDWIAAALQNEKPRLIATILRHLPGHHVEYVLDKLPAETLKAMPPLWETFSIEPSLARVIRKRFEKKFPSMPALEKNQATLFSQIPRLTSKALEKLFRALGFHELAIAFKTLNGETIELVLRRLPNKDAQALREQLLSLGEIPHYRLKQAQINLLSLKLAEEIPYHLVLESGFLVYSKALMPPDLPSLNLIKYKLSQAQAEVLQSYVDRNLSLNFEKSVMRYRKEIEDICLKQFG